MEHLVYLELKGFVKEAKVLLPEEAEGLLLVRRAA
jgi:hypothetical protein